MAKIKVAIYDADKLYRERFADYLMSYKAQEIELAVFSGTEYFFEAINVDKYQLLVLGCGYEEILPKVKVLQIPVLVLSEQNYVKETIGIEDAQVSYTSKYQSMDVITHQMYLMAEARRMHGNLTLGTTGLEVVGVFSPVRHEMQMFFSVLYAQNMAQNRKVLYLNLMEFSGFSAFFGEEEYDLEEVILQLRETVIRPAKVFTCIYERENFSYICPFHNPDNLKEVYGKDIELLIKFLTEYTDYHMLVIDFGGMPEGFAEILKCCTKLYCLSKTGTYYETQTQQFLEYVKNTLGEAVLERVKKLELPYQAKGIGAGANFIDQLKWSEFGDFVRGV